MGTLSIKTRKRLTLLMIVGACRALATDKVEPRIAELMIFGVRAMHELACDDADLRSLIHQGIELSSIRRLVPDEYANALGKIETGALEQLENLPLDDQESEIDNEYLWFRNL